MRNLRQYPLTIEEVQTFLNQQLEIAQKDVKPGSLDCIIYRKLIAFIDTDETGFQIILNNPGA